MRLTYGQALERVAERTIENRENWKRALTQRRSTPTSIYGIRFYNEIDATKHFEYHFSIMPNLKYFTRFSFRLYVRTLTDGASIDPDTFTFEIGNPSVEGTQEGEEEEALIDITDFLMEQDSDWVDGTGYFPAISWEDGDEAGSAYDILDVCSMLTADDRDDDVDAILSPGEKVVKISCPTPCEVTWIPYIEYTTVNR